MISYNDFSKVEIHAGTVLEAGPLPNARKPAYVLTIDFGELGIKKSSAQITDLYTPEELIGKQVVAVTNFPPKQVGNVSSECLVLGFYRNGEGGEVVLAVPERKVPNGKRLL